MSANFTPSQSAIKDLKPFRYWCQKVLPTVYDDSLSYYELLTKVVNYLNDTIDNVDALNGNVQNIYDAYILLQNYVNEYFDNNFPQLVSDKLDEMAEDGTLTALIKAYIDPYFDEKSDEIDATLETQNETITLLNSRMDAFINQHSGLAGETMLYNSNGTPVYSGYLPLNDDPLDYNYLKIVWKHRYNVCVQEFESVRVIFTEGGLDLNDALANVNDQGQGNFEICKIGIVRDTGDTVRLRISSANLYDSTGYASGAITDSDNTGILRIIGVKNVSDTEVVDARTGANGTVYDNLEQRLNTEIGNLNLLETLSKSSLVSAINEVNSRYTTDRYLRNLSDVLITNPVNGQVLAYDMSTQKWINITMTGGDVEVDSSVTDGGTNPVNSVAVINYINSLDASNTEY